MSGYNRASVAPLQSQLHKKEIYLQTSRTVHFPDSAPKRTNSPTTRCILATSYPDRELKFEPATDHRMGYDHAVTPPTVAFEEDKTLKKRLSTFLHPAWRALWKCICSPLLSELDDVHSSTAQLLYADRYQPIYGYGSIAAGAKPTIIPDDASSRPDNDWSSTQRGSVPHGAQPTPKENFVV